MRKPVEIDDLKKAREIAEQIVKSNYQPKFTPTAASKQLYCFIIEYIYANFKHKYQICENPSTCKAIGITGNTGSGKTLAMYMMRDFCNIDKPKYMGGGKVRVFKPLFKSAKAIATEYNTQGGGVIETLSTVDSLIIDDLGSEKKNVNYFGTNINVMQTIIEERYSNNLLTHFTTNFTMDEVEEMYGDRVRSRLHQMTNIIEYVDIDHRMK